MTKDNFNCFCTSVNSTEQLKINKSGKVIYGIVYVCAYVIFY